MHIHYYDPVVLCVCVREDVEHFTRHSGDVCTGMFTLMEDTGLTENIIFPT